MGLSIEKGGPVVRELLEKLKTLEKEGYEFEAADASFELLIRRTLGQTTPLFDHVEFECVFRRDTLRDYENCLATVKLHHGEQTILTVAEGGGPVNALDSALRKALIARYPEIAQVQLTDYKVRIIDGHSGTAARTRVLIDSTDGTRDWSTVGVSGNIIDASWRALVDSIEYFLMKR
jgi:2-isopropylmalate synthase